MSREQTSNSGISRRKLLKCGLYGGLAASLQNCIWLTGCNNRRRKDRPNVILISMDTVRRDHCSLYGYEKDTTPNLSLFAQQGTNFDLAYAPTSTTGPSHATFFTSLYPITHRVIKNGLELPDKYETLAEILKAQGYQTAAVVSSFVLDAKFGYAQGFAFYDDDFPLAQSTVRWNAWEGHKVTGGFDRRADFTTKRAIQWIKLYADADKPFFLFVHYFDPHKPYTPPEPFRSIFTEEESSDPLQRDIGLYDAEIAFTDYEIGNLLMAINQMKLEDTTVVIITSDHGEGLMQHGWMYHGVSVYEELVRVPLIFRWPGHIPKGRIFTAPVGLINLTPTILDLLGIDINERSFQGQTLAPSLYGQDQLDPNHPVYLYRRHYKEQTRGGIWVKGEGFGLRVGNWKYILCQEENKRELFDLAKDPQEMKNLYTVFPDKARALSSQLETWKESVIVQDSVQPHISEDDLERLKSLGYVE